MIRRDKRGRFLPAVPAHHIRIYRFEHVECRNLPRHGPFHMSKGCTYSHLFGWRGNSSRATDLDDRYKYEDLRHGVTLDQARYWYDNGPIDELMSMFESQESTGWAFGVYDVPVEEARETRGQYVFVSRPEYYVADIDWRDMPAPIDTPVAVDNWHSQQRAA